MDFGRVPTSPGGVWEGRYTLADSSITCRLTSALPLDILQPMVDIPPRGYRFGGRSSAISTLRWRTDSESTPISGYPPMALWICFARMACKPDFVALPKAWRGPTTIPLGPPSPTGSSGQPGSLRRKSPGMKSHAIPIWPCSWRGLPCHRRRRRRGGLLPHRFTLTSAVGGFLSTGEGGLISVALSLGLPRAGVTRRHSFPESGLSSPRVAPGRGRPAIRARSLYVSGAPSSTQG